MTPMALHPCHVPSKRKGASPPFGRNSIQRLPGGLRRSATSTQLLVKYRRYAALHRPFAASRGTTAVELLVATALLATVMVAVGRFASTTRRGLDDRQLSAHIAWELANAREQIGAWPAERITHERIEGLAISAALQRELDQPRWRAEIERVAEPLPAQRVTLRFECQVGGQSARPAELTFWVPLETTETAETTETVEAAPSTEAPGS